jgi:hypothetical protein
VGGRGQYAVRFADPVPILVLLCEASTTRRRGVSGNLELHASAAGLESEAAALDVSIEIPGTPVQIERTLKLGIKYAEARPGQTDVRIVMPDPNERLRGIG